MKHRLDLARGAELFDGRPVVSYPTPRGDETRFATIGVIAGVLVAVIWTERGDTVRLISLRRARDAEKRLYRDRLGG